MSRTKPATRQRSPASAYARRTLTQIRVLETRLAMILQEAADGTLEPEVLAQDVGERIDLAIEAAQAILLRNEHARRR